MLLFGGGGGEGLPAAALVPLVEGEGLRRGCGRRQREEAIGDGWVVRKCAGR
jgi:hypothetical protein